MKNIKIVYGAWELDVSNKLYAKHCFFLKNNEVIDPTFFTIESKKEDIKYFSVKEYTINEFLNEIENNDGDINFCEKEYREVIEHLYKNGIILLG